MKQAYFDASAIVKLSHVEPHSAALIEYLERHDVEVSTSVVAEVEVIRALRTVGVPTEQAIKGFYLLALDGEVCKRAAELGSPQMRSIDAIHLATALAVGDEDLDFVTYDDRRAAVARELGLNVVQPGLG